MKYGIEIGSGAKIYIPSVIKIGSGIKKVDVQDTRTTQTGWKPHKHTLIFFKIWHVG
jgi:hypothetical protein